MVHTHANFIRVTGNIDVGDATFYIEKYPTPEEAYVPQEELKQLLGDGTARVSTSLELRDKNMGSGYGAFVTVTISCDSAQDSIDRAAEIGRNLAQEYVEEALDAAEESYHDARSRRA